MSTPGQSLLYEAYYRSLREEEGGPCCIPFDWHQCSLDSHPAERQVIARSDSERRW